MNKYHFIGLHVLFLTSIVHSYVLFTANIEDVRKLARKFVSDSLAEKIADFIARATQQMVTNVSEENDMNADNYQDMSDGEVKITRSIGRQRYDKINDRDIKNSTNFDDQNNHAYEMLIKKYPNNEYDYGEKITNEKHSKLSISTGEKVEYDNRDRREKQKPLKSTLKPKNIVKQRKLALAKAKQKSRTKKGHPKLKQKSTSHLDKIFDADTLKQELKRNKLTHDQKHKISENNGESNHIANEQALTSTLGYAEKFLNEENNSATPSVIKPTRSSRPLKQNQHILTAINSNEISENKLYINQNKALDDLLKFTTGEFQLKRASIDLTTEKERTEFDQYDNKNYPKAEFVATSGPVALPRIPAQKPWWERAIPNVDHHKDKSWF